MMKEKMLDMSSLARQVQSKDSVESANALLAISAIFNECLLSGERATVLFTNEKGEITEYPLGAGARVDHDAQVHLDSESALFPARKLHAISVQSNEMSEGPPAFIYP